MNTRIIRAISIFLLLAVMTAVFCFSAEAADDSQQTSDDFLYNIITVFYPKIKTMPQEQIDEILDRFSSPIRKLAHFSIYGLMGVFSLLSVVSYVLPKFRKSVLFAMSICVFYAVTDEIHQYFVSGRSCELRDVLIDSSGALLGVLFTVALLSLIFKKRTEKSEKRG